MKAAATKGTEARKLAKVLVGMVNETAKRWEDLPYDYLATPTGMMEAEQLKTEMNVYHQAKVYANNCDDIEDMVWWSDTLHSQCIELAIQSKTGVKKMLRMVEATAWSVVHRMAKEIQ